MHLQSIAVVILTISINACRSLPLKETPEAKVKRCSQSNTANGGEPPTSYDDCGGISTTTITPGGLSQMNQANAIMGDSSAINAGFNSAFYLLPSCGSQPPACGQAFNTAFQQQAAGTWTQQLQNEALSFWNANGWSSDASTSFDAQGNQVQTNACPGVTQVNSGPPGSVQNSECSQA